MFDTDGKEDCRNIQFDLNSNEINVTVKASLR